MQIPTKFLGVIECDQQDIIHFSKGLPGFEEEKEFILVPIEKDSPFAVLQSIHREEVGFVVAYPFLFKHDYAFDISEEDQEDLGVEKEDDVIAYSIITLKEPFQDSTMNLLAPVIINSVKKVGKQIVLRNSEQTPLRFPLKALEGSAT